MSPGNLDLGINLPRLRFNQETLQRISARPDKVLTDLELLRQRIVRPENAEIFLTVDGERLSDAYKIGNPAEVVKSELVLSYQ